MDKTNNENEKVEFVQEDDRLTYERPDLLDVGKISDVTLSNGNNNGADGGYS